MTYTNRSNFPANLPNVRTQYCWNCRAEGTNRIEKNSEIAYFCKFCSTSSARTLIFDPNMEAWFNEKGILVHESCGIFLRNRDGKLLLFKRTKFPYLLTIPAGHLECGEDPVRCAVRETQEEIGIKTKSIIKIFDGDIVGDSCLGGADIHKWHAYSAKVDKSDIDDIKLDEEGSAWGWYDTGDLDEFNTVQPVIFILNHSNGADKRT